MIQRFYSNFHVFYARRNFLTVEHTEEKANFVFFLFPSSQTRKKTQVQTFPDMNSRRMSDQISSHPKQYEKEKPIEQRAQKLLPGKELIECFVTACGDVSNDSFKFAGS